MGEISTTGKWVDTQTGTVTDSEPVEGRQLVAPGGEITPTTQNYIDNATATAPPSPAEDDTSAEEDADEPQAEDEKKATAAKETATDSRTVETSALDSGAKATRK